MQQQHESELVLQVSAVRHLKCRGSANHDQVFHAGAGAAG